MTQIVVLAKAPIAGLAKTRLIPALGPQGAGRLQRRLTCAALRTALESDLGTVTLWCAPDPTHRFFRAVRRTFRVDCRMQPDGDLGARMHAAFSAHCRAGAVLLIGTDCPVLEPAHLQAAARSLAAGDDVVIVPAEDGGYVLVGLNRPRPDLFTDMPWSTAEVMAITRERARGAGLRLRELDTLWDVDVPADLARLQASCTLNE